MYQLILFFVKLLKWRYIFALTSNQMVKIQHLYTQTSYMFFFFGRYIEYVYINSWFVTFAFTHLNTLSLGLPLRCSLPGWERCCLSWFLDSFSAAAMGHPERLKGWRKRKINIQGEHVADHVNLHHSDVDWHIRCPAYMNICACKYTKGNARPACRNTRTQTQENRSTHILYSYV